jgi:enoyl-CoA hydratase
MADENSDSDVLFRREGALGRITLNRPKALNALTTQMVAAIARRLDEWGRDDGVRAILIDAVPGRAFCAGGDIRAILDAARREDGSDAAFFRTEYRLNAAIHRSKKPYVALIDGYAFGGGLGVSVHGAYRVVSENAAMAMPETLIGFYPDIGASYFLNRCPGEIGMYLALTGARIKGGDLLYSGLATHAVPSARIGEIGPLLARGKTPDEVLAASTADLGAPSLRTHRAAIDRAFCAPTVEAILAALVREGEWGKAIAKQLSQLSPTSLKLTHRLMRENKGKDLETCLTIEYRLALRQVLARDFAEGVRAAVVDKDQRPHWEPGSLGEVRDEEIVRLFAPLGARELTFPAEDSAPK